MTLKCVSDGVPTPTLTWYKPDGSQINRGTATQNTVNMKMNVDQDFGGYKCDADNGLAPADFKIVKVEQIGKCSFCFSRSGFYLVQREIKPSLVRIIKKNFGGGLVLGMVFARGSLQSGIARFSLV